VVSESFVKGVLKPMMVRFILRTLDYDMIENGVPKELQAILQNMESALAKLREYGHWVSDQWDEWGHNVTIAHLRASRVTVI
jgi:hypothetical protein